MQNMNTFSVSEITTLALFTANMIIRWLLEQTVKSQPFCTIAQKKKKNLIIGRKYKRQDETDIMPNLCYTLVIVLPCLQPTS